MTSLSLLTICLAISLGKALGGSTLIWQGFKHEWLHHMVGFETPHRIGSIKNQIGNDIERGDSVISGNAEMTFTPGVNGDYSKPQTFYSAIFWEEDAIQTLAHTAKFSFNDSCQDIGNYKDNPEANTTLSVKFEVDQGEYDDAKAILQGFDIQMKCIEENCNSDGIWPFVLDVSVAQIESQTNMSLFEVKLIIDRGYTPGNGGGRSLNKHMTYEVSIPVQVLLFSNHVATSYSIKHGNYENNIFEKEVPQHNSQIFFGGDKGEYVTGITQFGFNLNSREYLKRGRYMEALQFWVKDTDWNFKSARFNFTYGYQAPKITTYSSGIDYFMSTTTILFKRQVTVKAGSVRGEVCESDWEVSLYCKLINLKEQLSDSSPIYVSNSSTPSQVTI